MSKLHEGDINVKDGVTCSSCQGKMKFIEIIQLSEKEISGKIPFLVKGNYIKKTFRASYLCLKCGMVELHPTKEV